MLTCSKCGAKRPAYSGKKSGKPPLCNKCYTAARAERISELRKEQRRILRYGLVRGQYDEMLQEQDYKCLICGKEHDPDAPRGSLSVDHVHGTGEIRGLLCDLCNRGLGFFHDCPEKLRAAARYVE